MSSPSTTSIQHDPRRARKAVISASMGNILEWYDIIVYSFMAPVISGLFFPNEDPAVALIATYLGVGVSYLIRPVGAVVLGSYSDRHGRKAALTLTIGLMTVGVAVIAFSPTYATIGIFAPVLLMLGRLIQGFSAGGEFGTATTFMTENAQERKAYYASWQVATQGGAMMLAGLTGWIIFGLVDTALIEAWVWRVPFILGILIGPIGLWIRAHMDDTPEFAAATEREHSPVRAVFGQHFGRVLTAAMCVGLATMSVYLITYLPSFAMKLGLPDWSGYAGALLAGIVALTLSPVIGSWADRVGQTRIMLGAAVIGIVVIIPLLLLIIHTRSTVVLLLTEVVVGTLMASYFAPLPSLMTQMFPVQVRTSGMALSYNIGVTAMGSFAPAILAAWVSVTLLAPALYYILIGVISIIGLLIARRVYDQP